MREPWPNNDVIGDFRNAIMHCDWWWSLSRGVDVSGGDVLAGHRGQLRNPFQASAGLTGAGLGQNNAEFTVRVETSIVFRRCFERIPLPLRSTRFSPVVAIFAVFVLQISIFIFLRVETFVEATNSGFEWKSATIVTRLAICHSASLQFTIKPNETYSSRKRKRAFQSRA